MKTLQIVGDSKYGGATYLILEWCKYLIARGCEVDVLSTDALTMRALQEISGVNIISDIFIPREITPITDLKAFIKLSRLFARKKYAVVHTYTATPGLIGRLAARISGVPAIYHHQAGWTVTEFSSWAQRLVYTPLEYFGTIVSTRGICVSNAVARQAETLHIAPLNKLVTICNGIDPSPFLNITADKGKFRAELGLHARTLIIGSVGRLSTQKDFFTLLRAGARLKQHNPELLFTIVIAGDGPDYPALQSLAEELGVRELVCFLGFRSDIPALLAGFDIYVSTSLWEGLSISLLEAMATASTIVATNILPNAELIEHEVTGLLVPPKSPEKIAEAIARFVREPALVQKCAAEARARVLKNYTLERMFQETWDLYLSLLGSKQPELLKE